MTTPPSKPKRKMKWYWHVLSFILLLWTLGGLNVLLLQDIPQLLFGCVVIGLVCTPMDWLQSHYPKKHWKPILFGFIWMSGCFAGIFAALVFIIPPFAISPQTTYLTEPRSKEFYGIDYPSVIEKELDPGVPTEDNGFRLLIETFGRPLCGTEFKDKYWHRLCQYLDLPVDLRPLLSFVDWYAYTETLTPEEQEIAKTSHQEHVLPWSEEAMPLIRQWLDENDAALDLFVFAIQKPVLYAPPMFEEPLVNSILFYDEQCRAMVRNLQVRVHYRLAIGKIDEAWDDVFAMYRLSEHHRRAVWIMVSSLVNASIMGIANKSAESVVIHSDWTADEILEKMEKIAPFLQPFQEDEIRYIIRNERFSALDFQTNMANGTYELGDLYCQEPPLAPNSWEQFKSKAVMRSFRLGLAMVVMNQYFDGMEQRYYNDEPEPDDTPNADNVLKAFAWYGHGALPVVIGELMSRLLSPAVGAWRTALKRSQAENLLLHFMFALEAYQRDHDGNYPATLKDLRGRYLAEIPLDPFSGGSFRYILEESGFLLYSVGPNGIDDEGRGNGDTPKGDDIRRRMPIVTESQS